MFDCFANCRNVDGSKLCFVVSKENEVFALETDATGRFIVSADRSGIINIWDVAIARFVMSFPFNVKPRFHSLSFRRKFPHPIRTIYEPYSKQKKLSKLALSSDGRSIVTASDGKGSLIKLWQWSFGTTTEIPSGKEISAETAQRHEKLYRLLSDSFELPSKYDEVESIRFNSDDSAARMFIVTTKNAIAFGQWVRACQLSITG